MSLIFEVNEYGGFDIYYDDEYIDNDIYSTTIENAIINFKNKIAEDCEKLLRPKNSCKECLQPCGYEQNSTPNEFYCPHCKNK